MVYAWGVFALLEPIYIVLKCVLVSKYPDCPMQSPISMCFGMQLGLEWTDSDTDRMMAGIVYAIGKSEQIFSSLPFSR